MHEMVYARKALDIVLDACKGTDVSLVAAVHLAIGEATDIVPEYVQDKFAFLARGTVAEHARLVIRRIAFRVACDCCGELFGINVRDRATWHCPACGAEHRYHLVSGREFMVEAIDVRTADDACAAREASDSAPAAACA